MREVFCLIFTAFIPGLFGMKAFWMFSDGGPGNIFSGVVLCVFALVSVCLGVWLIVNGLRKAPRLMRLAYLYERFNRADGVTKLVYVSDCRDQLGKTTAMYVPARSENVAGFRERFRLAWKVFIGEADALTWPENDGIWFHPKKN